MLTQLELDSLRKISRCPSNIKKALSKYSTEEQEQILESLYKKGMLTCDLTVKNYGNFIVIGDLADNYTITVQGNIYLKNHRLEVSITFWEKVLYSLGGFALGFLSEFLVSLIS